jgi:K(+)-stimulated pyrophosphate-energized sodium pump
VTPLVETWGLCAFFVRHTYVATVLAAMVLGNYVIKDMGGRIDDAFGVSGQFYYQWQLPVLVLFSIIGTLLVKIDRMLKRRSTSTKSVKYWKLGSIG